MVCPSGLHLVCVICKLWCLIFSPVSTHTTLFMWAISQYYNLSRPGSMVHRLVKRPIWNLTHLKGVHARFSPVLHNLFPDESAYRRWGKNPKVYYLAAVLGLWLQVSTGQCPSIISKVPDLIARKDDNEVWRFIFSQCHRDAY